MGGLQEQCQRCYKQLWEQYKWCDMSSLFINPNIMVVIPFTRKRDMRGPKDPTFPGKTILLSTEVPWPNSGQVI